MKPILDACCGSRMWHFDKANPLVEFCDNREHEAVLCDGRRLTVKPDRIMDFRCLDFADGTFDLVLFDPPHLLHGGERSWIVQKYGRLDRETWREDLRRGFAECWRVLRPGGTLVFKWSEVDIHMREIRPLFPAPPVVGTVTTKKRETRMFIFYKPRP